MTKEPIAVDNDVSDPQATAATLAATWLHLMRAAEEPSISVADSRALIERADTVLDRLAEAPANTEAALVAEILFRPVARRWGMHNPSIKEAPSRSRAAGQLMGVENGWTDGRVDARTARFGA